MSAPLQPGEDRSLVLWEVYVTRTSGAREWLGSLLAPVCLDAGRPLSKHALEEARRQYMAVLKDDDPEVEPEGTTLAQLTAAFKSQGLL